MDHQTQVSIIKELQHQVRSGVNVDAAIIYKCPTSVYTDPALADQEWRAFFEEHPQIIGLSGDLPEKGSYISLEDFGVPILATRDQKGRFRTFVNACRHRGARLTSESRGIRNRFVCPYHSWTYANSGELVAMPQPDHFGPLDKACFGLIELPSCEHAGLLWVHPQPEGRIDVSKQLGQLEQELIGLNLGEFVQTKASTIDRRLNWKLAIDTFGETYHVKKLHRDTLSRRIIGDATVFNAFGRNHRFVAATQLLEVISNQVEAEWNLLECALVLYFLFPNVILATNPAGITLFRIYPDPKDSSRSITQASIYQTQGLIDAAKNPTPDIELMTAENALDPIESFKGIPVPTTDSIYKTIVSVLEEEDYPVAETTQQAADSGTLQYLVFGKNEPALHHVHNVYSEALGLPRLEYL
ncbi:MAG: aromatic ring-hydroxylating dioxygenase subunit alpha [Pseudomonadota bacterium]